MKKDYLIPECKKCWHIHLTTEQETCLYWDIWNKNLKIFLKKIGLNIENNTCNAFEIINSCHQCGNQHYENSFSNKCVLLCKIHPEKELFNPDHSKFKLATEDEKLEIRKKWKGCTCGDFTKGSFRETPKHEVERNNHRWFNSNYYGYS